MATDNTNTLFSSKNKLTVQVIHIASDATEESAVVKVDKSTLTGPDGNVPDHLVIEEVVASIQGYTYVKIDFDATTDDEALVLGPGQHYLDFRGVGGLHDPKSTGNTGDIVFTTVGAAANTSYDITLKLRLHD